MTEDENDTGTADDAERVRVGFLQSFPASAYDATEIIKRLDTIIELLEGKQ